jgi:hypothetical protein
MGFLPNIFKVPSHDILPNILTGGTYSILKGSLQTGAKVLVPALHGLISATQGSPSPNVTTQRGVNIGGDPNTSPNIIYGSPQYSAPSYGGYGFTPSYQPVDQFYGGSPWGSSTQSFQPLTTPYRTSSAQTRDRSWEDLIAPAAALFL